MNILITGGFGFIGSNLSQHYLDQGHFVTVIDNLSTTSLEHVSKILNLKNENLQFIKMDLSSPDGNELLKLDQMIKESDLIFHLAGAVGVKFIDKDPRTAIRKNITINQLVFPLFEKHQKKVIFASTSEVYGEAEEARETDTLQIGPPDILRWGYACGKLMSEFLLKTYTFPHVIARFFNVTGKGQLSEHGMVLPTFVERAKHRENLVIYGDGSQYRSFCDIRDAVAMLDILGSNDVHNGEIYNIGNPYETYTIKELAQLVVDLSGSHVRLEFKDFHDELSSSSEDIIKRKPNTDKIMQYYKYRYTLKDTIQEMLK